MADIEDGAKMALPTQGNVDETQAVPRPKKFTGRKKLKRRAPTKNVAVPAGAASQLPDELKNNPELDAAISILPSNYNFEVCKTIWKVKEAGAQRIALQFPEGLLMFACIISDIVRKFTGADTVIMGDVTYGACCVDDLSAKALGCDFMVHYGHSCLVPIDVTSIKMLYVFVEITFDTTHLVDMIKEHFDSSRPLAVMGTIQFAAAIHKVRSELGDHFPSLLIPKCKPLSPGEVLGCTSPKLPEDIQEYVFVADGRFHLESAMIHNPTKQAFRYNPYDKTMTKEGYEHEEMRTARKEAIDIAAKAHTVGLILGTLGRQGNPAIMQRLKTKLKAAGKRVVTLLMSEIFPQKLALMPQVDAWVQVACPRLSVDWGTAFSKPLLNPYEAEVALATAEWAPVYPMDYYASGSGSWTNYHKPDASSAAEQSDAGVVIHSRPKAEGCGSVGGCACSAPGYASEGTACCKSTPTELVQ